MVVLAKGHAMPQMGQDVASSKSKNNFHRIVNVQTKGLRDMSESRWVREGRSNWGWKWLGS